MAVRNDPTYQIEKFNIQDIDASIARLQSAFHGNYGKYTIQEEENPIGNVTPLANKIAITFRGSLGTEVLNCTNVLSKELRHIGLEGKAHKGIHESFQKIRKQVHDLVKKCLSENPLDNPSFIIEGYSRGAGMAVLSAAYIKKKFPTSLISVLTYSPLAILDEKAAQQFTTLIGKENCLSFVATEDFLPYLFEKIGFYHVGKKIEFSVKDSPFYRTNVQQQVYPYLSDNPMIASIVKLTLGAEKWNAHMLESYADVTHNYI